MAKMPTSGLWRYGGALVVLLLATLLRQGLDPILGTYAPFPLYLMAVVFTARYGGRGPALMVLLFGGLLANYLFTEPRGSLRLLDAKVELGFGLHVVVGLLIIHATDQLRISRARAAASEARLRMAAQAGAFGTFDIDYVAGQGVWSDETCAIFGLAPGIPIELDANEIPKAVHPEDYERVLRATRIARASERGDLELEHRIIRPDGSERWVSVKCRYSFSGEGSNRRTVSALGAVHDITQRKLADVRLQQHAHVLQERLKELECLYAVARLTQQPQLSDAALAQVVQTLAAAYQYPEVTCVRIELDGRVHQTENFRECEWRQHAAVRTDAREIGAVEVGYLEARPAAAEGPFLREERHLIDAVAGLLAGSFHRWLDRAALVESETRFRHLVEAMPEILYRGVLPHYTLTFVSPPVERLLGFTPTEWLEVRDRWWRQMHDEDRGRVLQETAAVRARPEVEFFTLEYRLWHKDGRTLRWFRDSSRMERDAAGRVVSFVGVLSDITERKRLEQQLQEADQRKDAFLATLSHELRNPLAPISNAFTLIRRGGDRPEVVRQALEMGERQMAQLVRLVDELLDIARISSGKITLHPDQVGLRAVVERAVESSRPQIEAGQHQLEVQLPESDVQLRVDPVRLAQALSNLLNNAAKYTESGGRIRLAARVESSSQELLVEVQDNGIGIPQEMLPHVFDLFTQGAQSRHRIWQGLGVGLPLAKYLVELHGGRLTAASTGPGEGCTFCVRLPLTGPGGAPRTSPPGEAPAAQAPPLRILVVDDDKDVADSTAMLLRDDGHEVHVANDGASAIELARAYLPAVVLLDIGLPGLNGYEVARRLRAQPELAATWLVALTGWGQAQDRRRSQEAGFDHHLVKPVDAATLEALLRACAALPRLAR